MVRIGRGRTKLMKKFRPFSFFNPESDMINLIFNNLYCSTKILKLDEIYFLNRA